MTMSEGPRRAARAYHTQRRRRRRFGDWPREGVLADFEADVEDFEVEGVES
jgi:hypothetical protein